jgi:hypothetical protein
MLPWIKAGRPMRWAACGRSERIGDAQRSDSGRPNQSARRAGASDAFAPIAEDRFPFAAKGQWMTRVRKNAWQEALFTAPNETENRCETVPFRGNFLPLPSWWRPDGGRSGFEQSGKAVR